MGVVPVAEEPLASESPTVESPLILGPVLRRVEGNRATVWVEAERPGVVEVRAGSASGSARTFSAHGHHYGFVVVEGLPPESETPYEVHFDGEVYGAIGWRLFQNFQGAGISKGLLLDDIVDGMNFTPSFPAFENMRDGILQSVANNHPSHECLVWDAFAHYGVGVGAQGVIVNGNIQVTESMMVPPQCVP